MSEQLTLAVWTDRPSEDVEALEIKGALPRLKKGLASTSDNVAIVASEVISANLRHFLASVERSITDAQPTQSNFDIDQVELNLVINATGGVELVGKLSAGAEASMKVVLKRKR